MQSDLLLDKYGVIFEIVLHNKKDTFHEAAMFTSQI